MCEYNNTNMPINKVLLLACGSYNPPTNMHLRMFEIARDYLHRMGNNLVVGGVISPVHDAYGKKDLESSIHRLAMIKTALQSSDWIKVSTWECKQESWSRTKQVLQYHQNQLNAFLHSTKHQKLDEDYSWIPNEMINDSDHIKIKLLCGGDLLESFGTPGLWADQDIEQIVGQHGLVVITRSNTNPLEFIYNSDILTKYMSNITIVTEWITNEVSSTKIRRALRRAESVKYLLPDKVVDYIEKNGLYGCKSTKYLTPNVEFNSNFLTPSSPSPTNCMLICNNTLFSRSPDKRMSIDTVDSGISVSGNNKMNSKKHPGQAVKIVDEKIEVRRQTSGKKLNHSKSLANFDDSVAACSTAEDNKMSRSNSNLLKECKSCDDNLIRFIFTKHGIQVISDVETIV